MEMQNEAVDTAGDGQVPAGYDPDLYRLRHSAAHVMAEAVRDRFEPEGHVSFGVGPPIENGFYYDFELPRPVTADDLAWIENRMREIIRGRYPFQVRTLGYDEARALFADQRFKRELIDDLERRGTTRLDHDAKGEPARLTVYQQDSFVDLCKGPHVPDTSAINPDAIKLQSFSAVYWRGDETKPHLQRIYGTAFPTREALDQHLWRLAEAERRDHRVLGRELELFHFEPTAPGMPYWLPNGMRVLNGLLDFWRREHDRLGYQEIASPLINEKALWVTSGHWDHYRDNMFLIPVSEFQTFGVKPMNCPNAMVVFNLKLRSYRDLPLRLSDCDILHRYERSGTLHGLLRVQRIQQDDAHIFITEDQIEDEYGRILDIAEKFYGVFGMKYRLRLGTRPVDFMGDPESWDKAESALVRILEKRVGAGNYVLGKGDGAFYGPKLDILMEDALGREWQTGTIQLDFQLPRRFDCRYTGSDGQRHHPVVVHRVIYGSFERFIGVLIEHLAGAFPLWLAPVQVALMPVVGRHEEYAQSVRERLVEAGVRVEYADPSEKLGARIRNAQLKKIPYALVVGDREAQAGTVSVRARGGADLGAIEVGAFIARVQARVKAMTLAEDAPDGAAAAPATAVAKPA